MNLTQEQLNQLEKALLDAFPDYADLEMMLKHQLSKNLREIAGENFKYHYVIFKLVKWANTQGYLEKLIKGACKENPENVFLKRVCEQFVTKESKEILSEILNENSLYIDKIFAKSNNTTIILDSLREIEDNHQQIYNIILRFVIPLLIKLNDKDLSLRQDLALVSLLLEIVSMKNISGKITLSGIGNLLEKLWRKETSAIEMELGEELLKNWVTPSTASEIIIKLQQIGNKSEAEQIELINDYLQNDAFYGELIGKLDKKLSSEDKVICQQAQTFITNLISFLELQCEEKRSVSEWKRIKQLITMLERLNPKGMEKIIEGVRT